MPDATGLELLAGELGDATLETVYFRERAMLVVDPAQIRAVLQALEQAVNPAWLGDHGGPPVQEHRA